MNADSSQAEKITDFLSDQEFQKISQFMRRETGIVLDESKRAMVISRLTRRVREMNLKNFKDYINVLEGDRNGQERSSLISCLTTNVTHFFRESDHFDDLEKNVLPQLIHKARSGGRVRIWSAGCSTGQEAYSIAAIVLKKFPDANNYDIRILGSDLDRDVIAIAEEGLFSVSQVQAVPEDLRKRFFRKFDLDQMRIDQSLQNLVTFRALNLLDNWPFSGLFDIIMCRNVTIYFDRQTQRILWDRFARVLTRRGRLYVGHSEYRIEDSGDFLCPAGSGIFCAKEKDK